MAILKYFQHRKINLNFRLSFSVILLLTLFHTTVFSQDIYTSKMYCFLSFGKIPTWVGVASDWDKTTPEIHLYDGNKYKGHAEYISVALKTGITFRQFKLQVKNPQNRKYLPFFLFDLRENKIVIDGIVYEWAVRVEDYSYEDSQPQMAKTVLKLMNTISDYIEKQSGKRSKGIIILATDPKSAPNTSIAVSLNKNGYPNLTLSRLIEKSGGEKAIVLSPGTAVGYLRYIEAGKETSCQPLAHDILIFENLPKRVPPVSGIITLEPQTALSHINLLAVNRGTINLYISSLASIPGAAALINKLVRIECSDKKISISECTEKEANAFWLSHTKVIDIPLAVTTLNNIISLNVAKPEIQNAGYIGAKAANYALIRQLFPAYVKPGYAIPFSFYFKLLKSCGADSLIDLLILKKPGINERNLQLARIRERISGAQVDPFLIKEIISLVNDSFGGSRIRLRSSTNCEDLPEFNGAGLYISKGYSPDEGFRKLAEKIGELYASLWSETAFEEREFYLINHSKVAMAILINEAFPNEYANGVVITIAGKNDFSILLNTQFGENSVTNPENGSIPEALLFKSNLSNNFEIITRSDIHDIFLQDSLKSLLFELKKAIIDLHHAMILNSENVKYNGYGVDVEFKIEMENGILKLYIKQARLFKAILPD